MNFDDVTHSDVAPLIIAFVGRIYGINLAMFKLNINSNEQAGVIFYSSR